MPRTTADKMLRNLVAEHGLLLVLRTLADICQQRARQDTARAESWSQAQGALAVASACVSDSFQLEEVPRP